MKPYKHKHMKKFLGVLIVAGLLTACNENGGSTEDKLDSLGKKIDTTAERIWDSTKEKAKDIKNEVEERLENRDSDKKDTTNK